MSELASESVLQRLRAPAEHPGTAAGGACGAGGVGKHSEAVR